MSATIHSAINSAVNPDFDANEKRAFAVAAALEVIAAKATQSGAHLTNLDTEFGRLSDFADKIQEALKVK